MKIITIRKREKENSSIKKQQNKIGRSRTIGAGRNRQRITPKLFFNSLLFNWFPFLVFSFLLNFELDGEGILRNHDKTVISYFSRVDR